MGRRVFKRDYSSYSFALLCVGTAALVRAAFSLVGVTLYFSTFYPAVLIAALLAGTKAGLLAVIASILYAWWAVVPPAFEFGPLPFEYVVNFAAFAIACAIIIWVAWLANTSTAKLQLAMDELRHRNKNTAAVLESILRQSLAKDPETAESVIARIRALTSANDLVADSGDLSVSVKQLLGTKLSSFAHVHYGGPEVSVPPRVARNLSLIVHELTTNALKYGALSSPNGRVNFTWQNGDGSILFNWDELDGPPVSVPQRRGFGTKLVTALVSDMGGTAKADFRPSGLHIDFSAQLRSAPAVIAEEALSAAQPHVN